ncbi:MAG: MBOAT family O-acyltransferase [Huintestinicola sp.]|uniref:MBOAT family O-acyltransferase n=1 Tax=Huintestinicola sp. TaxID=2981661 RepID=UPI003F0AC561
MVFSELSFLYFFLPIVMLLYFVSGNKLRNIIIFITGLLFYAWGEPFYVIIMLLSTAIDYTAGRLMDKYDDDNKKRKICLIVSVCMNVGLLAVFKYSDFIFDSINGLLGTELTNPVVLVNRALNKIYPFGLNEKRVDLPVGISFFTFQSMSYTIDLYLRNISVQKSFLNFASYVSLFPQIVAGPIVRYEHVAGELESRSVTVPKISAGIALFVKGLAKKVLLANNVGAIWSEVKAMDYGQISAATAWLGILAFTFQIYFDFSGYSDMASGLGKMLGFEFPKNFDHPYISRSVSEFWRRWHITLGSWFRSYVYIPLGGNRCGALKTYRNLFIVWALTGLWHGASWNFVLWGLYFGVLIIIERLGFGKVLEKLPSGISMLYTFLAAVFGWVLFDTDTLGDAGRFIAAMFGAGGAAVDGYFKYTLVSNCFLLVMCILISGGIGSRIAEYAEGKSRSFKAISTTVLVTGGLLLCTAYLVDASYNPFLYFRF